MLFPKDTSAAILTSGLLGKQYLGLTPGNDDDSLAQGGKILYAQSAMVLKQLISKFLYGSAEKEGSAAKTPDQRDLGEGFNRGVYKFNDGFDRVLLKPVAQAYTFVTPEPVRDCIHNIFNNVNDIWAAANSFLQGNGHDGVNTMGHFMLNTTMGIGGCFDVASTNGANIRNDFGVTLGVWSLGQEPYLVLPIWGASSVRDGVGLAGDFFAGPLTISQIDDVPSRNSLWSLRAVDARAKLLNATDTVDRVALDPYSFIRDAYLQRRAAMVLGSKVSDEANLPNYDDKQDESVSPGVQK